MNSWMQVQVIGKKHNGEAGYILRADQAKEVAEVVLDLHKDKIICFKFSELKILGH